MFCLFTLISAKSSTRGGTHTPAPHAWPDGRARTVPPLSCGPLAGERGGPDVRRRAGFRGDSAVGIAEVGMCAYERA